MLELGDGGVELGLGAELEVGAQAALVLDGRVLLVAGLAQARRDLVALLDEVVLLGAQGRERGLGLLDLAAVAAAVRLERVHLGADHGRARLQLLDGGVQHRDLGLVLGLVGLAQALDHVRDLQLNGGGGRGSRDLFGAHGDS